MIDEGTLKDRIREKGPDDVFETEHPDKMKVFRGRVLKQMSAFWRDETGIKYEILKAMMDFARRDDLLGWVRGDVGSNGTDIAFELARLSSDNERLRQQLNSARPLDASNALTEQLTAIALKLLETEIDSSVWTMPDYIAKHPRRSFLHLLNIYQDMFISGVHQMSSSQVADYLANVVAPRLILYGLASPIDESKVRPGARITDLGKEMLKFLAGSGAQLLEREL